MKKSYWFILAAGIIVWGISIVRPSATWNYIGGTIVFALLTVQAIEEYLDRSKRRPRLEDVVKQDIDETDN